MALIRCPECKKENVSASADTCLECGYPIKSHFDKIKVEKFKEDAAIKQQAYEEREKIKREVAKIKQLNKIADEINLPQKRPLMNVYFFLGMIFTILDLIFILMALDVIKNDGSEFPILIFLVCSFFAFILLYGGYLEIKKQRSLYDQFSDNPEEYRKQLSLKHYNGIVESVAQNEVTFKKANANIGYKNKPVENDVVHCPNCGSTQFQMVNRRWTIGTGFLNNKIDRVCMNCKNKF